MRRLVIALAVLAALLWAPPRAYAAGNELTGGQVAPTSGSTATVFVLSVTYTGRSAASAVNAEVAGRSIALTLGAGTPEAGVWSAPTLLPAGTWQVTFAATSAQGTQPTLAGPTVVVSSLTTAAPSPLTTVEPAPAPSRSASETRSATDGGGGSTPSAPAAAPAGTPAPASGSTAAPAPISSPAADDAPVDGRPPPASTVASLGSGGLSPPGGEGPSSWPGGAGPSSAPEGAGDGAPASTAAGPAVATSGLGVDGGSGAGARPSASMPAAAGVTDGAAADPVALLLLVGLSGVTAVALVGSLLLIATRRRSGDRDPSPEPIRETRTPGVAASGRDVDAVLERRVLRRARLRLSDDPIVAAMGLGSDEEEARRRRRGRQTGAGPGELPRRRRPGS